MKKKFLTGVALVAAFALSAMMFVGCSSDSTDSDDAATAEERTTLIVGFDAGYPPYGYVGDDGEYTGFDLELATAVCDIYGWELVLEPIDWDAKDALIESGTIDCIWNGFTMEGREDSYTFSDAYMLNEQVLVVKADSGIASWDDLAGAIVMTQVDSAALDVLEGDQADLAATFEEIQTISDYNNAFMQLESGMVDAVACDLSIAAYYMAANEGTYVMLDALSSEHYGVGFKLGETELAAQINDALAQLDEEGFVEALCDSYADQGITYDNWVL